MISLFVELRDLTLGEEDLVGLQAYDDDHSPAGFLDHQTADHDWWVSGSSMLDSDYYSPSQLRISFGDGATRDRLARWLAYELRMRIGSTAPLWSHARGAKSHPIWALVGQRDVGMFAPGPQHHQRAHAPRRIIVPGLEELDPRDDTRLADRSRRVDALALALAATSRALS